VNRPARKRFGQNFLVDGNIIRKIADSIRPNPDVLIIEIGPGRAALTAVLLERGATLIAVELDRDLAKDLEHRYSDNDQIRIHQGDALKTDFTELASGQEYRLVGNLPYNISTPLIFHLLKAHPAPLDMHFMLQKEVVERMAARPGSRNFGRLSVMVQNQCEVDSLFRVGPESFDPRPKVDSGLVRLQPRTESLSGRDLEPSLDKLVRQAFSLRRKTLRNSLASIMSGEEIVEAGVDPKMRAEQLDLEEFFELARVLKLQSCN
jgi:16S rRNA (adenine1518-N6/adenine1519-N6)-dimethyltransferase